MKLHLPKSLFLAITASTVCLPQTVTAETLTPLTKDGWHEAERDNTNATNQDLNNITIDKTAGTATLNDGWRQNQAHYDLGYTLGVTQSEALTFSITFSNLQQNARGLFAIALVGAPKAVVLGDLDYDPRGLMYGVSYETNSDFYLTSGEDWENYTGGKVATNTITGYETTATNTTYKVNGTIAWSSEKNEYVMTLKLNDSEEPVATADLGTIVDINKISLYVDGQGATFSELEVSGTKKEEYARTNLTWNGTEGNNTWNGASTATPWKADDTDVAFSHYDNVTFDALTEGMSDTVIISKDIFASSVTINDNYTIQADGTARLDPGTLTIAEGKTITYSGNGDLTIVSDLGANLNMKSGTLSVGAISGDVEVTGGTLNLSGQHAINGDSLSITNGTVFIEHNAGSSESSAIHKDTDVSIGAGGTLHIKGHDAMGWGQAVNKVAVKLIQLEGTADKKATLKLEEQGSWAGYNSIGYELKMQGHSNVIGIGGNNLIDGASVTATNTGNTITFEKLQISKDWNVTVEDESALAISVTSTDVNKTGHIIKKGAGALTLTGTYVNALDLEAGSVSVSGKLTGNVTVTGGELTVSGGDAISGSTLSITNGTVNVSANDDSAIGPNTAVSILAGGTLNASGHDMFHYNQNALSSISLKGETGEGKMATLNIADTGVCTMTTLIDMQGNSQVTGNKFSSFAMDTDGVTNTGVRASGTNNVIATDEVQVRANWVLDVTNSAELEVSSVIKNAGNADTNGKLIKKGEGTLILSGANTQTLGTVIDDGKVIADNDKAMGGGDATINKGTLQVGAGLDDSKDVNLTIAGNLSLTQTGDGNKVTLSEGSSLTLGSVKFTGTTESDSSISRVTDGNHGAQYAVSNASYVISNAAVEVKSDSANTMYNRLMGVALTNSGTGKLTAGNGNNNLTELQALTGDIDLTWYNGQGNQGTISNLNIAAERTVGAYVRDVGSGKATVTVSGLTAGAGATLNANLTLTNSGEITFDGALALGGSTLTLGTGLTLNPETLAAIKNLSGDERYELFTGVGALTLGGKTYYMNTDVLDATSGIDLSKYFNLTLADAQTPAVLSDEQLSSGYYLGFDANGTLYAGVIPEPTTATLSLLALAALAARRRRK